MSGSTMRHNEGTHTTAAAAATTPKEKANSATPAQRPVVGIVGAKGGCGATTIAVNLAAALSHRQNVTLVDADLQNPGIGNLVGIDPPHSLLEILDRKDDFDQTLFNACRVVPQGTQDKLGILTPPIKGEAAALTNLTALANSFQVMRGYSDFWLIDMPRHLDKHFVNVADLCDKIVLVFEASVAGVAACQRWLATFAELEYAQDKIICVLNRSGSKFKAVENELKNVFSDRVVHSIPNASSLIWDSATRALIPVQSTPNHPYSRAIQKLAAAVHPEK